MGFFQQIQFITPVLSSTVKKKKIARITGNMKVGSDVPRNENM